MPEEQAKLETTHAIVFAAANHTKWFWDGVYGVRRLATHTSCQARTMARDPKIVKCLAWRKPARTAPVAVTLLAPGSLICTGRARVC